MSRYKPLDYNQTKLLPINYSEQLILGSFEFTLNKLVDDMDLSLFDARYQNAVTGATAYHPSALLKIILFAYSLGITSSRRIAELCKHHVIFMALSADSHPHFTTIATFVRKMPLEISELFLQILFTCDEMGLIGKEMFSIDGCKLPSNASKENSGTREDFEKKKEKLEVHIGKLMKAHKQSDKQGESSSMSEREEQYLDTLKKKAKKIKNWLKENKDKKGTNGKPIQSNITDNDTAKMKTSNGIIQGVNGIAIGDDKHQVIVAARAVGSGNEQEMLIPMVEETRQNFKEIGKEENIFAKTKLTGDCGFSSKDNAKELDKQKMDAYIPDNGFRKRDEYFNSDETSWNKKKRITSNKFEAKDFTIDSVKKTCICPAGNQMLLKNPEELAKGESIIYFQGRVPDCRQCPLRQQCLRNEDQQTPRQFSYQLEKDESKMTSFEKMKVKIDSKDGKLQYSKRLGIIEPIFGNIVSNIGLKRFTLRGKAKLNAQWLLFTLVHNIGKIQKYGTVAG